jgi:hypothetical protein
MTAKPLRGMIAVPFRWDDEKKTPAATRPEFYPSRLKTP